jgi:hypothetical protein
MGFSSVLPPFFAGFPEGIAFHFVMFSDTASVHPRVPPCLVRSRLYFRKHETLFCLDVDREIEA